MRFYTDEELPELLQVRCKKARELMKADGFENARIGRSSRLLEEEAFLDRRKQKFKRRKE